MLNRPFWLARLAEAWRERNVVWLMGVRRAGKTVLAQSVPASEYVDCERPSVRRQIEDHESFLAERRGTTVVLDEIHRLPDAAQFLKLAADHFHTTRVLATGSSTLGASARFRDTLAGRKREVWLTPMVHADLAAFKHEDLSRRLLRGGLPPFFLADEVPEQPVSRPSETDIRRVTTSSWRTTWTAPSPSASADSPCGSSASAPSRRPDLRIALWRRGTIKSPQSY